MYFIAKLAKLADQLEKASQRCGDEDVKKLVSELYNQIYIIINTIEKIYMMYMELDILMKTNLKADLSMYLDIEMPQHEKLSDYINRAREAGRDPDKTVAYLLSAGFARLELKDGELYIRGNQRY